MTEPPICGVIEPVSGEVCGLYAPHPNFPHRVIYTGRPRARGEGRIEWNDRQRWEKFGHQRFNVQALDALKVAYDSQASPDGAQVKTSPGLSGESG